MMKIHSQTKTIFVLASIIVILLFSCKKEKDATLIGRVYRYVKLNDGFPSIQVGLSDVQVIIDNGKNKQQGTTGAEGNYRVEKIKPGDDYRVYVSHKDFILATPSSETHTFFSNDTKSIDIEVKPKPTELSSLSGLIYDIDQQKAISGVTLTITQKGFPLGNTFSNENGLYEFKNISKGIYQFIATHNNYVSDTFMVNVPNLPFTFNVPLKPKPIILGTSSDELNFGSTIDSISLNLTNIGARNGTIHWNIENLPSWLKAIPNQGLFKEDTSIFFTVDRETIATGSSTNTVITINGNDAGEKRIQVSVSKNVATPILHASPTNLDFGTTIIEKSVVIKNAGGEVLNWTINKNNVIDWIKINKFSGRLKTSETDTILVTVDRNNQSAGPYINSFDIKSNEGSKTIKIDMEVTTTNNDPVLNMEGLIGYYPFNGNADDESPNHYPTLVNGATLTTDRNGKENSAYYFDEEKGTSITIKNPINSSFKEYTISLRIKYEEPMVPGKEQRIITLNNPIKLNISLIKKAIYYRPYSDSTSFGNLKKELSNLDEWIHVVCIHNVGKELIIFINGVRAVSDEKYTNQLYHNSGESMIGNKPEGLNPFNGSIDDVIFFNRALSEEEIRMLRKL